MKLHYVSNFPPDLSLFILERKSASLHRMFANVLDIEEKFRLLGTSMDQGSTNESAEELGRVEMHETEERSPWKLMFSPVYGKIICQGKEG